MELVVKPRAGQTPPTIFSILTETFRDEMELLNYLTKQSLSEKEHLPASLKRELLIAHCTELD